MPYATLAEFLTELQDDGELVRIPVPVDSALELAAITDRVAKSSPFGGPALLFENVKNSTIPVVTNLLGSQRRLCRSLGVADLNELAADLDRRLQSESGGGWLDAFKLVPGWGGLSKWTPKLVKTAACQQVVRLGRDVNLWDLPTPRCWPDEPYPVITTGQIVTSHPETGMPFLCQSPLVVTGQRELAWYDENHEQRTIVNKAIELKQNLPVAISLGGDPALSLAIAMPGITDARMFAGLLRNASPELVRCRTNDLDVPAGAEIIIEGYVDAANSRSTEAHTVARGNGRYVRRELPLIQVTAITHRANPVFPAMITASPPSEESWIAHASERMMLPLLKRLLPEIVDIHRPFCAAGRNLLFVSIRKAIDHQARRILNSIWGMEPLGQTKLIVIVDADIDVQREDQVWLTVGNNACPSRDFIFSDGLARDDDYTPLSPTLGSRVGIDATRKKVGESSQPWPQSLAMSNDIVARISERWFEYGFEPLTSDSPNPI